MDAVPAPHATSPRPALAPCSPWQEATSHFAVTGGTTLELTLAQYWSSLGDASLQAELAFHGVLVDPAKVQRSGCQLVPLLPCCPAWCPAWPPANLRPRPPSAAALTPQSLLIDGAGGACKVYAQATLKREKVKPQVPGCVVTVGEIGEGAEDNMSSRADCLRAA